MLVILKKDIDKVGRMGETKDVAPGFARNYLIANNLAVASTDPRAKEIFRQLKNRNLKHRVKPNKTISHRERRLARIEKQERTHFKSP